MRAIQRHSTLRILRAIQRDHALQNDGAHHEDGSLRNEEMYSYFYHPLYIVVSCVLDLIIICKHLLVFVLPHVVEESANNGYGNVIEFPEV